MADPARLAPLTQRMTKDQLVAREARLAYRRGISREHGLTRGLAMNGFALRHQGFFGRIWWMLTGRLIVPTQMK